MSKIAEKVIELIAKEYHVSINNIMGTGRSLKHVRPRHMIMNILKRDLGFSFTHIAEIFKRNHSTVIHAVNSVEDQSLTNKVYKDEFNSIRERVRYFIEYVHLRKDEDNYEELLDMETEQYLNLMKEKGSEDQT